MKNRSIVSSLTATLLVVMAFSYACRKDNSFNKGHATLVGVLAFTPCDSTTVHTGDSIINTNITTNLHLGNVKRYILDTLVYVTGNHVLTIDSGALIAGKVITPGIVGPSGGGLVITKGSQIIAKGTAARPIVFTSANSGTSTAPQSGDWCGIILLGQAPTNRPVTTIVEGIIPPAGIDGTFGGNLPHDNSGMLKYVRIEYAGFTLSNDNEINALTMAGVGDGTVIDFVEAFKANDDSFEWFGGTVNASHLISVDALDDMFDTDAGYTGTIKFALGLADQNRADISQSNGFESDNALSSGSATPITHPHYKFVTIAGVTSSRASVINSIPSGLGRYGRAAYLRNNTEFSIDSCIFLGYNQGLSMDYTVGVLNTLTRYETGLSSTRKLFAHGYFSSGGLNYCYTKESLGAVTNYSMKPADNDVSLASSTTILPLFTNHSSINNFITSNAIYKMSGAFPNALNWTKGDGATGAACTSDHPAWVRLQ